MAAADGPGVIIFGPDGYNYKVVPPIEGRKERFVSVGLRVSDLASSTAYWCDLLGMAKFPQPAPAPSSEAGESGGGAAAASGLRETVGYGEEQVGETCFVLFFVASFFVLVFMYCRFLFDVPSYDGKVLPQKVYLFG